MQQNTQPMRIPCRLSLIALLSASAILPAKGDYQSQVLAQNPIGYWRLNETNQPPAADIATNRGSLGTTAAGYYLRTSSHPMDGAVAGSTNTAVYGDRMA